MRAHITVERWPESGLPTATSPRAGSSRFLLCTEIMWTDRLIFDLVETLKAGQVRVLLSFSESAIVFDGALCHSRDLVCTGRLSQCAARDRLGGSAERAGCPDLIARAEPGFVDGSRPDHTLVSPSDPFSKIGVYGAARRMLGIRAQHIRRTTQFVTIVSFKSHRTSVFQLPDSGANQRSV